MKEEHEGSAEKQEGMKEGRNRERKHTRWEKGRENNKEFQEYTKRMGRQIEEQGGRKRRKITTETRKKKENKKERTQEGRMDELMKEGRKEEHKGKKKAR